MKIPVKIIIKPRICSQRFVFGASGRVGEDIADDIFVIDTVTNKKHFLVKNRIQIMKISDIINKTKIKI